MNERKFNSIMGQVNNGWGANVLGMAPNSNGPDAIDNSKVVELKHCLIKPHHSFYS